MNEAALTVEPRAERGKQAAKQLRRNGLVPGVYYFHGQESVAFSVSAKDLRTVLTSKSNIIDVNLGNGETAKCVIREVQWDPVLSVPLHVDLLGVKLTEKVTVEVPIQLIGSPVGVKNGGVLQHQLRELEIECLPLDIPDTVDVDVSGLDINDAIHVSELKLDNVEILADPEQIIVSVIPPRIEEEEPEEVAEEEAEEPELIRHGKKEEGDEQEETEEE